MRAELILATRGRENTHNGLATFVVEVPVYIWTELLTHKRLARNASSSRAQSQKRHAAMGWYTPPVFYEQGSWMSPGEALPEELQEFVRNEWESLHQEVYRRVAEMDSYVRSRGYRGIAKEQVNRLLPTTKMVRGVLTGTEDAWKKFLLLRHNSAADRAMQEVAHLIAEQLHGAYWWVSEWHIPFDDNPTPPRQNYHERARIAAARLARVSSGAPGPGRRSDLELASDLLEQKHLSPFEHIARWSRHPRISALAVKPEDFDFSEHSAWGWTNYRSELEEEEESK